MSQLQMQHHNKQAPSEPHHDFLSLVNMLVISAQPQLFSARVHTSTLTHSEHLQSLKLPSHLSCMQSQILYKMVREDINGPNSVQGGGYQSKGKENKEL